MEQHNPEKIPLNPVRDQSTNKRLYETANSDQLSGREQVIKGMFKRTKQEPVIALKYKLLLAFIMVIFIIVAVIVGKVLFRNGLI